MRKIRILLATILAVCLSFSILSIRPQAASPFTDVDKNTSGYTQIMWAYNNGLIKGVGNKKFNPNGTLTKAQITVMIWRYFGSNKSCPVVSFTDTRKLSANVRSAISWAVYHGYIDPSSSTKYGPNVKITRKEMATILWRLSGRETAGEYSPFMDISSLPSESQQAVIWCYENSIAAGTSSSEFSPNSYCTRAQFCIFLYRFDEMTGYTKWSFGKDGNIYFTMKMPAGWIARYRNDNSSGDIIDLEFLARDSSDDQKWVWEFSNSFGTGYFPYDKSIQVGSKGEINVMYHYYKDEGIYAMLWYSSGDHTWGGWFGSTMSKAQFLKVIKTLKMLV